MSRAELERHLLRVIKENGQFDELAMRQLLGAINVDQRPEVKLVSRLEVVDHRANGLGRAYACRPCSVALSFQDEGKTLKVFVGDAKPGVNWQG